MRGPTRQALYEERLREQGGVCAICGSPPGERRLARDHDHVTGHDRGLLCARCNLMLGAMESEWALSAARYLSYWDGRQRRRVQRWHATLSLEERQRLSTVYESARPDTGARLFGVVVP